MDESSRRDGSTRTVVLFLGLPYTGKTALIHRLKRQLPGEAIYVDSIFRDIVPEEEVCLDRWLAEGPRFVETIVKLVDAAESRLVYVELGIMQRSFRTRIIEELEDRAYRVVPLVLECESTEEIARRQQARADELTGGPDKRKIAIGLEELFGRIHTVFEPPTIDEVFLPVDTAGRIEESIAEIIKRIRTDGAA